MTKHLRIIVILVATLFPNNLFAELINKIEVVNNDRISKQTIVTYGKIELNQNYEIDDINQIIKNLYNTNFFENIEISINKNTLIINVVENKIIQNVLVEGIKSKSMEEAILENIFSKNKSPFLINKIREDVNKIKYSLDLMGYYFSKVESNTAENSNNTVDLIFNITLGDKAKISRIEFIGDKKIKDRTLRNIIISEESKFWKFISKNKFLNKTQIERDERLLKSFYLNKGYYDVQINSSTVDYLDNNTFKLIYKINAGVKYFVNKTSSPGFVKAA